jgi:HK97 family phage portal protein
MGLADLVAPRGNTAQGSAVEFGSDGDWWRSMYTPWPGLINDAVEAPYVTAEMAEGLPGIGRGIELITGVIAQLYPHLYANADQPNMPTILLDTPPVLVNPDPLWHGLPEWLSAVVASLFWYGDGFAYRGVEVSDYRGYPTRLPLLDTTRMSGDGTDYYYSNDSGQTPLDRDEVLHFILGARPTMQFGRGILDRYQTELKIMLATEQAQYVLMKDGKPMGILSLGVDVNQDQAKAYKEGFLSAVRESGVAAIGNADFKPVQWSSADLSMVPTREFNLRLASDIVGVPPYLLGVPSESRVYANMETEWTTFIRVTLGRYLRALESGLTTCFPRGQTVKFDLDALLRSDAKTRFEVYSTGITIGVLTVDEVRAKEDLPPLPKSEQPDDPADESAEETDPSTDPDNDAATEDQEVQP